MLISNVHREERTCGAIHIAPIDQSRKNESFQSNKKTDVKSCPRTTAYKKNTPPAKRMSLKCAAKKQCRDRKSCPPENPFADANRVPLREIDR